jgi:hypothetical protein
MIDTENPVIRQLVEQGYKISFHAYLRDARVLVSYMATHAETKRSFQGRSRKGDRDEALRALARSAGLN